MMSEMMVVGFLGAGHLASYTVAGLRHAGDRRRLLVSPRNAKVAAELAEQHGCEIALSNQALVDACDVVLLSVRPDQHPSLLAGLQFKTGQLVISVMAGVSTVELREQSNLNDATLVRSLPIQCSAVGVGPVPVYPANEVAQSLLGQLGSVVVLSSEEQFEAASTLGCMHGWIYPWLAAMTAWAEQQGLDQRAASQLTQAAVAGALAYSEAQGASEVAAIGEGIATEGTYTLAGLDVLQPAGGIDGWIKAMELVSDRAKTSSS